MNGSSSALAPSAPMAGVPAGAQFELFTHGCGWYSLPANDAPLADIEPLAVVDEATQPLFH